ncbi:MAG: P-loop NTPase [Bacteroidota bacterium]
MANPNDPAALPPSGGPMRDGDRARLARELRSFQDDAPLSPEVRNVEPYGSDPIYGMESGADGYGPQDPNEIRIEATRSERDGAPVSPSQALAPSTGYDSRPAGVPVPRTNANLVPVPLSDPPPAPLFPNTTPPRKLEARRAAQEKNDILRRGWKLILGITALIVALTVGAVLALGPQYDSYAILLVNTPDPNEVQTEIMGRFVDTPGGGESTRRVLNQAIILQQSPVIAERAAERLMAVAEQRGEPFPIFDSVTDQPLTPRSLGALIQESYVNVEPAGLEVDAVRVSAKGATAEEAHMLAQFYMEEYQRRSQETSREFIERTSSFLAEQRDQRQAELNALEAELSQFRRQRGAVDLGAQAQQSIQQVASLEAQLDRARVDASMREQSLQALERELAELQPRLTQRIASGVQGELRDTETKIAELEQILNNIYVQQPMLRSNPSLNPDVARYEAQLSGLRARRAQLSEQFVDEVVAAGGVDPTTQTGEAYVTTLRQRISQERVALEGARAEAAALRQRLGAQRGQLLAIPGRAQEVAELERARSAAEQSYQFLESRLNEAEVAAESEFGVTQVVREPQVPLKPSRPNWPMTLPLALGLGLLLGVGAAFARYRTDTTLYAPSDLAEYGFPVLGVVPEVKVPKGKQGPVNPALVTLMDPFAPAAESYRHLQASLYARLGTGSGQTNSLVVTSPEVGSGKSVTAINLAISAAQAGLRTLIVDADLRRPSVHDYLGLGPNPPVGNEGTAMNMVYWNTSVNNLFALTVREPVDSPEQLWSGEEVYRLIDRLNGTFDLIIFDAPPALVAADASFFAVHTDAAVLVASAGGTSAEALTQTAAELTGAGGYIAGVVLNRFDPKLASGHDKTFGYRYTTEYTTRKR